jgi:hypothetical protein
MASPAPEQPQSVRFSDVNQEIEPEKAVETLSDLTGSRKDSRDGPMSPEAEEELRNLSSTLQKSRCQAKRMENFSFEPVSLPPSRVSNMSDIQSIGTQLTHTRLHRRLLPLALPLAIPTIALLLGLLLHPQCTPHL